MHELGKQPCNPDPLLIEGWIKVANHGRTRASELQVELRLQQLLDVLQTRLSHIRSQVALQERVDAAKCYIVDALLLQASLHAFQDCLVALGSRFQSGDLACKPTLVLILKLEAELAHPLQHIRHEVWSHAQVNCNLRALHSIQ